MSDQFRAVTNTTVGQMAPFLHTKQAQALPEAPAGYEQYIDVAMERKYITPFEGGSFAFGAATALGNDMTFRIDSLDTLRRVWLEVTVGIPGGTPGTFIRLQQCAPLRMIEALSFVYQNQTTFPPDMLSQLVDCLNHDTAEKQADRLPELYYTQTPAQRSTLATASQTFLIPIPTYWFRDPKKAPYLRTLSEFVEFRCTLGRLANILETDYTSPTLAISAPPRLLVEYNTLPTVSKAYMASLINTGNGWLQLIQDWQTSVIAASLGAGTTNSGSLQINSLRRETPVFYFLFRPASFATNYTTGFADFDAAYLPSFVTLQYDNGTIQPRMPVSHLRRQHFQRFNTASEWGVLPICFAQLIEEQNQVSGSVDCSLMNNLTVIFEWNTATSINLHIQVMIPSYNQVQQLGTQYIKMAQ